MTTEPKDSGQNWIRPPNLPYEDVIQAVVFNDQKRIGLVMFTRSREHILMPITAPMMAYYEINASGYPELRPAVSLITSLKITGFWIWKSVSFTTKQKGDPGMTSAGSFGVYQIQHDYLDSAFRFFAFTMIQARVLPDSYMPDHFYDPPAFVVPQRGGV